MSKKLEQLFRNFMVSEGRAPGTPSIKRYTRPDGTTALKSLNKWGKRKDWRDTEGGLAKAREHAGVEEITEETGPSYEEELPQILKDIRGKRKSHSDMRREYGSNWKRLTNATSAEHGSDYNRSHLLAVGQKHMEEMNENFMDGKGPGKPGDSARHGLKGKSASELRSIRSSESASPRKKQLAHWLLNMHHNKSVDEGLKDPEDNPCWKGYEPVGTKKKNGKTVPNCVPVSEEVPCSEPITTDPNLPTSRLIGTDSIVKVFKKATPGQNINESFDLAFDYQGKPQLAPTAGQLMMQAKGAFAHHTDVQNVVDVQTIKEAIQRQFEQTVLEEDTDLLEQKCEILGDMVDRAFETIAAIKESNVDRDAWSEAQILKLESYIESVAKYLENISEDSVPVIRRSYMRTDPRTGERKRVKGRVYKRRRDFDDDEDDKQDLPRGPLSV